MLRSELHTIEILVHEVLNSGSSAASVRYDRKPTEFVRLIALECDRLRSKWTHHLFSRMKEQVIFRYVRFHQSGLTHLSDQLSERAMRSGTPSDADPHLMKILQLFDDLLQFLQRSLNGFFETGMPESRFRREQEQKVYLQMVSELEADLQRLLPASSLPKVIISSLSDQLLDFPNERISYRQSSVIGQFISSLRYFLTGVESVDEKRLFLLVYKMNLNSKRLVKWFKQAINNPGFYTLEEAHAVTNEQRSSSHPPVDAHELAITEALFPLLHEPAETPEEKALPLPGFLQLPLNLSVAQFALFCRVCYRAGCFSLNNAAEIIRFFTAHFTTKRQGNISVKSFTKGFYAMDQTSAAVVRDFLQRMITFINKTYFP